MWCLAISVATRKWTDTGSVRDLVHSKQRPKTPFAQKYARSNGRPLPLSLVQTYGRHILEVLLTATTDYPWLLLATLYSYNEEQTANISKWYFCQMSIPLLDCLSSM